MRIILIKIIINNNDDNSINNNSTIKINNHNNNENNDIFIDNDTEICLGLLYYTLYSKLYFYPFSFSRE